MPYATPYMTTAQIAQVIAALADLWRGSAQFPAVRSAAGYFQRALLDQQADIFDAEAFWQSCKIEATEVAVAAEPPTSRALEWQALLSNLLAESHEPARQSVTLTQTAARLAGLEEVISRHYGDDLDETSVEAGIQMERDRWTPRLRHLIDNLREDGLAQVAMALEAIVDDFDS